MNTLQDFRSQISKSKPVRRRVTGVNAQCVQRFPQKFHFLPIQAGIPLKTHRPLVNSLEKELCWIVSLEEPNGTHNERKY